MDPTLVIVLAALALVSAFHLRQQLSQFLCVLLCCLGGLLMLPVISVLLASFWLYRRYVIYRLSKRPGFVSLMDGIDAYWAQETTTSSAIPNLLLMVEFRAEETEGAVDLKTLIIAKVQNELLSQPQNFKLTCKRMLSKFGYYFWEVHVADMDKHVRWMDLEEITEESLKEYLSRIANGPLPYDNRAVWEVLVGRKSLEKDGKKVFPVFVRMHHSIGDGISLLNMFLTGCTDEGSELSPMKTIEQKMMSRLSTEMKSRLVNVGCMSSLLHKMTMLILVPFVLVSQVLTPKDENVFRRGQLSGEKHVLWSIGNDSLSKIRRLKQKLKCTFFDIALLAVSDSLEEFFKKSGKPPVDVTLVSPVRLPLGDDQSGNNLSNRFTVIAIKLPISEEHKLETICSRTRRLPLEPHYLVNYWTLKVACAFLPVGLVRNCFRFSHQTLALSNIPGPVSCAHIDGHAVTDAMFWVTNRDTVGVGISMLSYNGKLTFTAHIDKACVAEKEEVEAILDGIVSTIDNMYDRIC